MSEPAFNSNLHIKNGVSALVAGFAVTALFVWIHQETSGWVALWSKRIAVATVCVTVLHFGAELLQVYLHIRRRRKSEREARLQLAEAARDSRRAVREGTREFALFLEDQYSWVLEMEDIEQERRALIWYDEITSRWAKENERFHKLRANDDCAIADGELDVGLVERMLTIWERRSQLYQYAIAWSNPAERAREILRIGRMIRQIQVEEAHEQQRFADSVQRQLAEQVEGGGDGYDESEIAWGPRPVQETEITGEAVKEIEPDDGVKEAGG